MQLTKDLYTMLKHPVHITGQLYRVYRMYTISCIQCHNGIMTSYRGSYCSMAYIEAEVQSGGAIWHKYDNSVLAEFSF